MASPGFVRVAVWGCGHGALDTVYRTIEDINSRADDGRPVDLLICCGDFQAVRNGADLSTMNCPSKYKSIGTFHEYYSGKKVAPVLTIFVGGNHEAASYMQELPCGGWVAPNIWYMGTSNVVEFRGLRIGGLSGIYKRYDYKKGYFETPPYSMDTIRSVNHVREFDVWKLSQVRVHFSVARRFGVVGIFSPFNFISMFDGVAAGVPAIRCDDHTRLASWYHRLRRC